MLLFFTLYTIVYLNVYAVLFSLQRFTNEDHLSVHKHKHEMTLKFGPARTDTVIIAGNSNIIYLRMCYIKAELKSYQLLNVLKTCINLLR